MSDSAFAPHTPEALTPPERVLAAVPSLKAGQEAAALDLRRSFCAELKAARERRSISLQKIAGATKVSESLFADLERGDLTRWPTGIYRRAFIREYAEFVGLPGDSTVIEFSRLFPEESSDRPVVAAPPGPLRLTLARGRWLRFSRLHPRAAALDAALVLLVSGGLVSFTSIEPWTALAAVALSYHAAGTTITGLSFGSWWIRGREYRQRSRRLRLAR